MTVSVHSWTPPCALLKRRVLSRGLRSTVTSSVQTRAVSSIHFGVGPMPGLEKLLFRTISEDVLQNVARVNAPHLFFIFFRARTVHLASYSRKLS